MMPFSRTRFSAQSNSPRPGISTARSRGPRHRCGFLGQEHETRGSAADTVRELFHQFHRPVEAITGAMREETHENAEQERRQKDPACERANQDEDPHLENDLELKPLQRLANFRFSDCSDTPRELRMRISLHLVEILGCL